MVDDNEELQCAIGKSIDFKENLKNMKVKCNRIINKFLSSEAEKEEILNAFKATVIFGQYEAGTGVIIDSSGVVLTCAHCLGERPKVGVTKILILHDGRLCSARAIKVIIFIVCQVTRVFYCLPSCFRTVKSLQFSLPFRLIKSVIQH